MFVLGLSAGSVLLLSAYEALLTLKDGTYRSAICFVRSLPPYDSHIRLFPQILLLVVWSDLVAAMIDVDV
jgi:hypothetical protein